MSQTISSGVARIERRLRLAAMSLVGALSVACGSGATAVPPVASPPPPARPPADPAPPPSKLSYGMVTSQVKRGETKKAELLELFGGPNISTTDREGVETWIYERTSTESTSASTSDARGSAQSLRSFFGGSASAAGEGSQRSTGSTSTTMRQLTVIVKFDSNDRVVDYAVRSSQF